MVSDDTRPFKKFKSQTLTKKTPQVKKTKAHTQGRLSYIRISPRAQPGPREHCKPFYESDRIIQVSLPTVCAMSQIQPFVEWDWHALGFHSPMGEVTKNLFSSQGLKASVAKIKLLLHQNKTLIELFAQPGSGATTLLKIIQKLPGQQSHIYICAHKGLSTVNLIKVLCHKLDLPLPSLAPQNSLAFLKQLSHRRTQARVLLDHAEELPETTRTFIQDLCTYQGDGGAIQFILAQNTTPHHSTPESIVLPPLSFDETRTFLQKLIPEGMMAAGFEQSVKLVYQDTQGNFRKIIQRAPRFLQQTSALSCPQNIAHTQKRHLHAPLALGALTLTALFSTAQHAYKHHDRWLIAIPSQQKLPIKMPTTPHLLAPHLVALGPFHNTETLKKHLALLVDAQNQPLSAKVLSLKSLKESLASPQRLLQPR